MFGNAPQTPYDLNFRLFGISVRVHPLFWVFTFLMGYQSIPGQGSLSLQFAVIWTLAVFVSILIHEFGHVLAGFAFQRRVEEVVLFMFGGYALVHPSYNRRQTAGDILICFAGPAAGFIFYGLLQLGLYTPLVSILERNWQIGQFYQFLLYINLYWGIFNLFPIFPLDGGQAVRYFLAAIAPNGAAAAHLLSVIVGAAATIYFYQHGERWIGIMFGIMAFQNFQILSAPRY